MIEQFQNLLSRFNEIIQEEELEREVIDIDKMKSLIQNFHPFVAKIKEQERIETPHYNFFRVLKIKHLEAIVHTPFLVNLLNPDASHSQGDKLLNIFLSDILQLHSDIFISFQKEYLRVKDEYKFSDGIIDILIDYHHPNIEKRFAIIIENKIYAGDQKNQLKRYYNYASKQLKLENSQIQILYLTPNGEEPSDFSIEPKLKDELYSSNVLRVISYGTEIRSWLKLCCEKLQSEKLRQTINQYLEIINDLSYEEDES